MSYLKIVAKMNKLNTFQKNMYTFAQCCEIESEPWSCKPIIWDEKMVSTAGKAYDKPADITEKTRPCYSKPKTDNTAKNVNMS